MVEQNKSTQYSNLINNEDNHQLQTAGMLWRTLYKFYNSFYSNTGWEPVNNNPSQLASWAVRL